MSDKDKDKNTSDIDKDIGKSELDKLMGVEEEIPTYPTHDREDYPYYNGDSDDGIDWDSTYTQSSLFDREEKEDDIMDIPELLKKQAEDERPAKKKHKIAKRKSFFNKKEDVPVSPGGGGVSSTSDTDDTPHQLNSAEIEWIVQDSFEAIMKPFDKNNVVVTTEDYTTIRRWLKGCLLRGIILDPETNSYKKIEESEL
tara:strand:+ start:44 stop:637 length:594 start_codon:yes stop_codon:yes gene_type:complete